MTKVIDFLPIPEYRKKLGLRLLARVDDFALYATDCYSFEVHKIRVRNDRYNKFTDELVKKKEVIASSEEFGMYAWCFERLSTVFRYFGFFADHVDEILQNLDSLDFEQMQKPSLEVKHGYVF